MNPQHPETMVACTGLFALGMVATRSAEEGRAGFAYTMFVLAMALAASIASLKE